MKWKGKVGIAHPTNKERRNHVNRYHNQSTLGDLVKIILPMTRAQALRPYS